MTEHPFHAIFDKIPQPLEFDDKYRRAPKRRSKLSANDKKLALKNALRYLPKDWHDSLKKEFQEELDLSLIHI